MCKILPIFPIMAGAFVLWLFWDIMPYTGIQRVILFNGNELEVSEVKKEGPYCWVSWYTGIKKIIMHRDGTADDDPFHYRWTLKTRGPENIEADHAWFDKNCSEPKHND